MKIEETVRDLLRDQAQRMGPAGDALPDILRRVAEPETRRWRPSHRLVAAIVAFATFAAAGVFLWSAFEPSTPRHPAGETGDPWASVGTGWTELPSPPESRQDTADAWTGRELISWGGHLPTDDAPPLADGFIFDPSTRLWQRMPAAPIARSYARAVWTGSEVLFWGGRGADGGLATDGAAFDLSTLTWRTIPDAPIEPRDPANVVWTGSEMIVWGGGPSRAQSYTNGAAYDPADDSWWPIANGPIALNLASGIWTGHEEIVFGSNLNNRNIADTKTSVGEAYDPTTDTWRTLSPSQLSPQATSAVWLGDRMLAWDYETHYQLYDPRTDTWTPPERMPLEASECYPDSVALGHVAFAWFCGNAALYDGDVGTWQVLEGGPLDQTIDSGAYKLWRFADLVPAGDVVVLALEGVTLMGGEQCYGCPGSPHSLWVYRPIEVTGTPITPSDIDSPTPGAH